MDEAPATAPDTEPKTSTTSAPVLPAVINLQAQADPQTVRTAAAFGWALVELLGRSFTLPQQAPNVIDWDTGKIVTLSGVRTPREMLRAQAGHIAYLADLLDVSSFVIDHQGDQDANKRYIDVLVELVTLLSQASRDPANADVCKHICGEINERLFFWDEKIYAAFQNRPIVVYKAYMAGRGLAALRWYFGLQRSAIDNQFLQNLTGEYLRVMSPCLPPFMPGALLYSVNLWGNAIIHGQVKPGQDGGAPAELQRQADIWYSLVTGTSDLQIHVNASRASRRFIWQVLRLLWPLVLAGLILFAAIIGLLVFVIMRNPNPILTGVTTAGGLLTLLSTYHTVATNVGGILQKAASHAVGEIKGSFVDSLWSSTQQKEVNEGTYIAPAGISNANKTGQGTA